MYLVYSLKYIINILGLRFLIDNTHYFFYFIFLCHKTMKNKTEQYNNYHNNSINA